MTLKKPQLIYGFIAGILIYKAFELLVSITTSLIIPVEGISNRLLISLPLVVRFVFFSSFGYLYLKEKCKPWIHWTLILLLALSAVVQIAVSIFTVISEVESRIDSMFFSGAIAYTIAATFLIILIYKLNRQEVKVAKEGESVRS